MSPFKNDLEAAIARAESAEQEKRKLEQEKNSLERQIAALQNPAPPAPPAPPARTPLEPPVNIEFADHPSKPDKYYIRQGEVYRVGQKRDELIGENTQAGGLAFIICFIIFVIFCSFYR